MVGGEAPSFSDSFVRDVLDEVRKWDSPGNKDVADSLGIDYSRVSKAVSFLEGKELIHKEKDGRSNVLSLTSHGKDRLLELKDKLDEGNPTSTRHTSITDEEQQEDSGRSHVDDKNIWKLRGHNCSVRAKLSDELPLLPKWFESWCEEREKDFEKVNENDYLTTVNGFQCRFTKDYVIVFLPEVRGDSTLQVKNKVFELANERLDLVVEKSPAEIVEDSIDPRFSLRRQELALMNDPFAEVCVKSDNIDLEDKSYRDGNGEVRFHIDCSHGVPELEFVHNRHGEDDATWYKEEDIGRKVENKEEFEKLFDKVVEGDLDKTEELLGKLVQLFAIDKLHGMGQRGKKYRPQQCNCERGNREGKCNNYQINSSFLQTSGSDSQAPSLTDRLEFLEWKMKKRLDRFEVE